MPSYQQGNNILNNLPRAMQVKADPNDLPLGQGIPQQKPAEDNAGPVNPQLVQEQPGEILDSAPGMDSLSKDQPHSSNDNAQIVTSISQLAQKANTVTATSSSDSTGLGDKNTKRSNNSEILQNGVSHTSNDRDLNDIILKDWDNDFEDMLKNISDNTPSTATEPTSSNNSKTTSSQPKTREKKETKNLNNGMLSPPMSRVNEFPVNSNLPQVSSLGNAPPYHNSVGGIQMRPQVPSPMSLGPQIRRHLVDHIQGRGRQQIGPSPYAAMGGIPMRESLVTGSQTKNPETMAKVQEHLLLKKQMQQRQMEIVRQQQMQQQMQQPYQQQTYQQQLIQMAQAAQQQQQQPSPSPMSPMMQSLSPHMQQQAFMQQNMNSPVPSPMSATPHLSRNPFQFPHDYNAYISQQKQMQGFEAMGSMPSSHEGNAQIPMNYYQGQQQEPHFTMRQQIASQGVMRPTVMQSAVTMRAMLARERMLPSEAMSSGQMMPGPLGPPGSFQPQPPKAPPPQYSQNNFSPPSIPLERPQLQRSLSHPRNRLSHFSHPDDMQSVNGQTNVSLKSPGSLPMYPSGDNGMYPVGGTASTITNGGQQNTNQSAGRMSDNSFSNFQSYGPPNMNLTNAMNSRTTMSPKTWAHESQLQKQQTLQQIRMNMNPDYRVPTPKGPTVNLSSRPSNVGQNRRTPAQFSSPMEKMHTEIPSMSSDSGMPMQQVPTTALANSLKQEPMMSETLRPPQTNDPSDDLESILSDPPENFDLVKNLLG